MRNLKILSLQHLARCWAPTPNEVKKNLIKLAMHPPTFSYESLFGLMRDMLVYGIAYEELVHGVKEKIKREDVRANYLDILALARTHFYSFTPNYVHEVSTRQYPIGRGLSVPFRPPFVYGVDTQICLPWFSFWKTNPLDLKQRCLFTSVGKEILGQDPDLESAKFEIFDFSRLTPGGPRYLRIYDAARIPRLSKNEIDAMMSVYVEGHYLAVEALAVIKEKSKAGKIVDVTQLGLLPEK